MNDTLFFQKLTLLFIIFWSSVLSGCLSLAGSNPFGLGKSWQEEVLLHDGRVLVVDRSVERGGRHEVGQKSPYKEQRVSFTHPDTKQKILWEDHFSQDLGMSNFLPMLLDVHNQTAYLVVEPMGCLAYNKWGRPNPPYVIFKYAGNQWQRIALSELPTEIKTPNMILSMPDFWVERAGTRFMTKEMIQKLVSESRKPEHQTILRKPLTERTKCGEMIPDGRQGWIGIGWFRNQPSYESCIVKCKDIKLSPEYCPCNKLFKGRK